jgi:hypothetical protein
MYRDVQVQALHIAGRGVVALERAATGLLRAAAALEEANAQHRASQAPTAPTHAPNALHLAATRTSMLPGYSGTVGPLCRTDQPGALTTTVHADVTCPDCRADAIGLGVVG